MPPCNGADRGFYPTAQAGRLPSGVGVRESWANRLEEAEQMTAERNALAGAASDGSVVGSPVVTYRLLSRPMQATACCDKCVGQCLSCMRGNMPVQF